MCAGICSSATLFIHELCVQVQNSSRFIHELCVQVQNSSSWIFPTACPLIWTAKRNDSSSVHSTWTMLCWKVQLSLICVFIVMFYGAMVDKKSKQSEETEALPYIIYIFLAFVFSFNKAYIRRNLVCS